MTISVSMIFALMAIVACCLAVLAYLGHKAPFLDDDEK